MNMIILSALGLFFMLPNVLCLSEEMQELANQLHDTCVGETGTTNDAIANARNGNFEDSDSFKCYIKCLLDQMAIIDDDGIIDVDAMVAVLPDELKEKTEPIIRKCGTQKGANPCENAWLTHKCYYKEGPEIYFLI
ncbi:general odorant-binding protein 83a-like [Anthonomus grandis grandis]|uniref:general odorant-binding protein 83a-like n=1 Tax=Anthonomus grandis grandis TaxID=2921223 RepID=UPI002164F469|nr:general odorant-binding protein 83a-like [Anthonomus grandis grandis]